MWHEYTGEIRISKSAFMNSDLYQEYKAFKYHQILLSFIWALSLFSIIALFFMRPLKLEVKKENTILRTIQKWPIDVRIICLLRYWLVVSSLIYLSYRII